MILGRARTGQAVRLAQPPHQLERTPKSDTSNTNESPAHNVVQARDIGVIIMGASGPVHTGSGDQIIYSTLPENHSPGEASTD